MKKSVILTKEVTLRGLKKEDASAWLRIFNSEKVGKFINRIDDLDTINKMIDYKIKKYSDNLGGSYSIIENKQNQVIGNIELKHNSQTSSAELSYVIDEHYWNKGFATTAAKILIKYAFEDLKVKQVTADTKADNYASNRILSKKLSMKLIDSKANEAGDIFNFYSISYDDYQKFYLCSPK